MLDPPHRLDQKECDEAEYRPEDDRQADELGLAEAAEPFVQGGHWRLHAADEVGDDARNQAREENRVLDAPEVEHLDPKDGPGDRRAENGREAASDPADHETAAVLVVQTQHVRKETRDRGPDLGAGPLFPDRAAEGERDDGREELDGRDLPRNPAR